MDYRMDKEDRLHFGEDYNTAFDHEFYAEKSLIDEHFRECQNFSHDWLIEALRNGDIRGNRILELGSGPSVYNVVHTAPYFQEIYLSDIAERNRDYITSWWHRHRSDSVTAMVKDAVSKEGSGVSAETREEEIRQKLNAVLPCNVLLSNPLHPARLRQVDAVIMRFVLDAAVENEQEYSQALANIGTLLPSGGYLIGMCVVSPHYSVKGVKFRGCGIHPTKMRDIWEQSDFSILSWKECYVGKKETGRHEALFNVLAKKK